MYLREDSKYNCTNFFQQAGHYCGPMRDIKAIGHLVIETRGLSQAHKKSNIVVAGSCKIIFFLVGNLSDVYYHPLLFISFQLVQGRTVYETAWINIVLDRFHL